jgi:hypothetical protein
MFIVTGPVLPAGAVMAILSTTRLFEDVYIDLAMSIVIDAGVDGVADDIVDA